jgi:hypothetical protein
MVDTGTPSLHRLTFWLATVSCRDRSLVAIEVVRLEALVRSLMQLVGVAVNHPAFAGGCVRRQHLWDQSGDLSNGVTAVCTPLFFSLPIQAQFCVGSCRKFSALGVAPGPWQQRCKTTAIHLPAHHLFQHIGQPCLRINTIQDRCAD